MESILFNYKKGYDLLSFSFWNWGKSIILICVLFQMICKHGYLQKAFKSVRAIILIHRKQWAVRSDYSDTAAPCLHLARFLLQTIWQWPRPGIWRSLADHPYRHYCKGMLNCFKEDPQVLKLKGSSSWDTAFKNISKHIEVVDLGVWYF